jgi:hypothetical protein
MLSQIIKFLDNNKLLTPYQFGFRKNYSTTSAILHLTCNILNSFEQNEFYHTYFLDLTKAFDCVSHELLIKKLLLYNFHPASTIVIFILSARRECFLCMKRSFTPRRRSRQYKPLNAQKHLRARNINNIFSIIDSKN